VRNYVDAQIATLTWHLTADPTITTVRFYAYSSDDMLREYITLENDQLQGIYDVPPDVIIENFYVELNKRRVCELMNGFDNSFGGAPTYLIKSFIADQTEFAAKIREFVKVESPRKPEKRKFRLVRIGKKR
jgi:hypothetical protein